NLCATVAVVIQAVGEVTKTGSGTLTLIGASSYTGQTTVSQGALVVRNTTGSATGAGTVQVNSGSLGGTGIIGGGVTLGNGIGNGALLSPGNTRRIGTLTIQQRLNFRADGIYECGIDSDRV